ncbi:MAG: nucleoside phosphorylase [Thermoproteota archaeon]
MEWLSNEESIVKPEEFAPKELSFVKLGIIVFIRRVYEWMKSAASPHIRVEKEEGLVGAKRFFATGDGLAVFHSYFGAPAAVSLAEALTAAGIQKQIIFGEAGSISPKVKVGEALVPTFAIREEGTSYHYLPPEAQAKPSASLLKKVKAVLDEANVKYKKGGVWTTDAPFRETMDKVVSYSRLGVLAVEMECSAVFCLSTYRRSEVAAILVITDALYEGVWKPAFTQQEVINNEKKISETLIKQWIKVC